MSTIAPALFKWRSATQGDRGCISHALNFRSGPDAQLIPELATFVGLRPVRLADRRPKRVHYQFFWGRRTRLAPSCPSMRYCYKVEKRLGSL